MRTMISPLQIVVQGSDNLEDALNKIHKLLDKNIECGLLLDWDLKVKDTELARKMYPDHCSRNGWLYAKKV